MKTDITFFMLLYAMHGMLLQCEGDRSLDNTAKIFADELDGYAKEESKHEAAHWPEDRMDRLRNDVSNFMGDVMGYHQRLLETVELLMSEHMLGD
jgi:hypothetical protein